MNTNYPKITIVTPNYNQGRFLERTILSVISQDYPNLEYIIIDGGSTDNSVEIIRKYSSHLKYWVSEEDNGQYDAINKGFLESTGEIMSYINSDDILAKHSLFSVAQIFSDYEKVEWLGGRTSMIDELDRSVFVGNYVKWNKARYLNKDYKYIQQEGVFWRRNLWIKVGSSVSNKLKMAADLELWSRFFSVADFYIFPGILGSFRLRSANQKTLDSMGLYDEEASLVLEKMKCTNEEKSMLAQSNSIVFKFAKRLRSKSILKYLGYGKINSWQNNYPPDIRYERHQNKFIIND